MLIYQRVIIIYHTVCNILISIIINHLYILIVTYVMINYHLSRWSNHKSSDASHRFAPRGRAAAPGPAPWPTTWRGRRDASAAPAPTPRWWPAPADGNRGGKSLGKRGKTMGNHGKTWKNHGKSVKKTEELWKIIENRWKTNDIFPIFRNLRFV